MRRQILAPALLGVLTLSGCGGDGTGGGTESTTESSGTATESSDSDTATDPSGMSESSESNGDGDGDATAGDGDGDGDGADGTGDGDGSTSNDGDGDGDGDGDSTSTSTTGNTGGDPEVDWLLTSNGGNLYRVDRLTGAATLLCELQGGGGGNVTFSSLTFSRDDRLFGSNGVTLFRVELPDCSVMAVGPYESDIEGMNGISPDEANGLFGVDTTTNRVYRIDPDTAAVTLVGPAGFNIGANGATWLESEQRLLAVDTISDSLYEVDTGTGAFSLLGELSTPLEAIGFEHHPESGELYLCSNQSASGLYRLETTGQMTAIGPIVDEQNNELNCNDLAAAWAAPDVPLPE